jgi:hypothetical protein
VPETALLSHFACSRYRAENLGAGLPNKRATKSNRDRQGRDCLGVAGEVACKSQHEALLPHKRCIAELVEQAEHTLLGTPDKSPLTVVLGWTSSTIPLLRRMAGFHWGHWV